jgi:hypothetical protein
MTVHAFRPRPAVGDTTGTASSAHAARVTWVVRALSDPGSQTPQVAQAIAILTEAAPGTGTAHYNRWATSTTATSGLFDNVVELIAGVIEDLDETEADYLFSESLPHFVPENWSSFLSGTAVDDPDFELPWLEDLD